MATSGTYGFALQADDVLTEAWERCGLNPEILTAAHAKSALRSIQLAMVKWTNAGLNLWQVDRITVSAPKAGATVTTPAGTTDILELVVSLGDNDVMLAPLGRQEWMALSNKALTGRPTQYWVERINLVPVIHLWPVPDAAYTLTYSRIRLPQDLSALAQTPDTPTLWLDALAAEVAVRLAVKYAPDRLGGLQGQAVEAFGLAAGENRERVALSLTPDFG